MESAVFVEQDKHFLQITAGRPQGLGSYQEEANGCKSGVVEHRRLEAAHTGSGILLRKVPGQAASARLGEVWQVGSRAWQWLRGSLGPLGGWVLGTQVLNTWMCIKL